MLSNPRFSSVLTITAILSAGLFACAQDPQPSPPSQPAQQESTTAKSTTNRHHRDEFLIHGTVFTDKALSLSGAQLRVRRTDEKKYRWKTYTNSRGEFALRVPPGANYEVAVQSKGFTDATRAVDAKNGLSEDSLVFRMELASERKK
jgi:Carboxypeptidase regulatory-like domain